jgi:hypothetical protein
MTVENCSRKRDRRSECASLLRGNSEDSGMRKTAEASFVWFSKSIYMTSCTVVLSNTVICQYNVLYTLYLLVKVKVNQSRYRPGVAQSVPGS